MTLTVSWKQGSKDQSVFLKPQSLMIGSLLSSQIQLQGDGVEPIHALLEPRGQEWLLTDLGAKTGVYVNDKKIEIETILRAGDRIRIGSIYLLYGDREKVAVAEGLAGVLPPLPPVSASVAVSRGVAEKEAKKVPAAAAKPIFFTDFKTSANLFAKGKESKGGETVEVIAYWKNTVLSVDHFQPGKGDVSVTIGDPAKANFIAAGTAELEKYVLATIGVGKSTLHLMEGMKGSLRRDGKMISVDAGVVELKSGDFAKIQYGPVTYFFLFTNLPDIKLPRTGPQDPLFLAISLAAMVIYVLLIGAVLIVDVKEENHKKEEDLWAVVQVPEKPEPPAPEPLGEVKKEALPIPLEPPPEALAAVPPKEEKPIEKAPAPPPKAKVEQALTQAKTQDKKKPLPAAGGGLQSTGGEKKGKEKESIPGPSVTEPAKPAGVNLSQLGLGVGKISSKTGPGAIHTNFKSSAGGVGKGSGSADKNYGLGGIAGSKALAVGGSGSALNQFGTGEGVVGDGKGVSQAFKGKGQVAIDVRAGDPLVSGGLTQEEILKVIRANINQIKNCYERWLQRVPDAHGKMKVQFMVGTDGGVLQTSIASGNISDSIMTDCVLSRIRKWKFDEPRGGKPVTVNYPFNFDPI